MDFWDEIGFHRMLTGGLCLLLCWIVFVLKKWEILCFRREESSSENFESKSVEDKLAEDLVPTPEINQPSDPRKEWASSLYKVNLCLQHLNDFIYSSILKESYYYPLLNDSSVYMYTV